MNKDNFVPIAFPYEGKYYVTSIADPVLGDSVIAFDDFTRVYTFDEERAQESDNTTSIKYTKIVEYNGSPIPEQTQIPYINPYTGIDKMLSSMHGRLTKKQSKEVLEDIRREPKMLPNDKCPCGSNLKYKKCCKNKI